MSAEQSVAFSQAALEGRRPLCKDPWNMAGSECERDRYQATMGALLRGSYKSAFEPGCSGGELTVQLARVCEHVTATDIAPSAVAFAQRRCAHFANVDISCADLAASRPKGPFDLILMSAIGYFFTPSQLIAIAKAAAAELVCGGEFVAVHRLAGGSDQVLHGDAVHSLLSAHLPLEWIKGDRDARFRIDTWVRA
jgi:protein-L-isoaspartate O-methyltransferase